MSDQYDVIICGAGPAGCTAALALGSSGLKIELIDKEASPVEKSVVMRFPPTYLKF
jgi:flavin-dependent dehydrogenase